MLEKPSEMRKEIFNKQFYGCHTVCAALLLWSTIILERKEKNLFGVGEAKRLRNSFGNI